MPRPASALALGICVPKLAGIKLTVDGFIFANIIRYASEEFAAVRMNRLHAFRKTITPTCARSWTFLTLALFSKRELV